MLYRRGGSRAFSAAPMPSDTLTPPDRPAYPGAQMPSLGRTVLIAGAPGADPTVGIVLDVRGTAIGVAEYKWEPFHVRPVRNVAFGGPDQPGTWFWPPRV